MLFIYFTEKPFGFHDVIVTIIEEYEKAYKYFVKLHSLNCSL